MVQARLGHEDIRTTINVYGHLLPSVEAALAEGLTATFNATAPPLPSELLKASVHPPRERAAGAVRDV